MRKIIFFSFILLGFLCIVDGVLTVRNFKETRGSLKIYDSKDNLMYESILESQGYQTPVASDQISQSFLDAVIAAEDKRFYRHAGVDFRAMLRAIESNFSQKEIVSGASTITQQVSRMNLIANTGFLQNKYIRKIREINSAFFIDLVFTKNQILNYYSNNVYFGNKSYGAEAASKLYFSKPAIALSVGESALLAGIIKAPYTLNPKDYPDNAMIRRNEVLKLMYAENYITKDQYDNNIDFPLGTNMMEFPYSHLHAAEFSIDEALSLLGYTETSELSGMEIYTTYDTNLMTKAQDSVVSRVEELKDKHKLSNASVVVMNVPDSAILCMMGSVDYFNEDIDGSVNIATSLRQPGSALKPITYAQALFEDKLTPESIIIDEKTVFTDHNGEPFVPYNYNGLFNGPVTARVALASSLNVPAVKVLDLVGVPNMLDAAQRLGITSLDNPDRYGLSVTLGGGEVSLLDLTNAYTSLARGGIKKNPYSIRRILDVNKRVIYEHSDVGGDKVWGDKSYEISQSITDILSDPSAKVLGFGRNNVLNLPFKSASKTGTTTDWHDNWTVGYTSKFSGGVWVGNANNDPMYEIDGVTGAGPIWRDVMINTHYLYEKDSDEVVLDEGYAEENLSGVANPIEITNHLSSPVVIAPKILNPVNFGEYFILPENENFERILLEISPVPTLQNVEYIMDGISLGKYNENTQYKHFWEPTKGEHTLRAKFYDSAEEIMAEDELTFTVLSR